MIVHDYFVLEITLGIENNEKMKSTNSNNSKRISAYLDHLQSRTVTPNCASLNFKL